MQPAPVAHGSANSSQLQQMRGLALEGANIGQGSSAYPLPSGVAFAPDEGDDDDEFTYSVEIAQHPIRARMCGFGDKDRRPLTPPLIVKVRAFRKATGEEVPAEDIESHFFVVQADLWTADRTREVNLVQHASSSRTGADPQQSHVGSGDDTGSSSAGPSSYGTRGRSQSAASIEPYTFGMSNLNLSHHQAPTPHAGMPGPAVPTWSPFSRTPPTFGQTGTEGLAGSGPPQDAPMRDFFDPSSVPLYGAPQSQQHPPHTAAPISPSESSFYQSTNAMTTTPEGLSSAVLSPSGFGSTRPSPINTPGRSGAIIMPARSPGPRPGPPTRAPTGEELSAGLGQMGRMAVTLSLVGNYHNNAHRLNDPSGEPGIFFVFHDLSVRTEGTFSLRVTFMVIGQGGMAMRNSFPIQGQVFTEPFEVFSAKKFPGMLPATELSQCFARQGLRIPTRKGPASKRKRDDGGADEGDSDFGDEGDDDQEGG